MALYSLQSNLLSMILFAPQENLVKVTEQRSYIHFVKKDIKREGNFLKVTQQSRDSNPFLLTVCCDFATL